MKRYSTCLLALIACALYGGPVHADKGCSVKQLAGNWMFATGIGRQMLGFPPDSDMSAIGIFSIDKDGNVNGRFDVTIENVDAMRGIEYWGEATVNDDCTGTIAFTTSVGSTRTDSIVVVDRSEMLAMSLDPLNLWTYQMRRLQGHRGRRD